MTTDASLLHFLDNRAIAAFQGRAPNVNFQYVERCTAVRRFPGGFGSTGPRVSTRKLCLCVGRYSIWLFRADLSRPVKDGEIKHQWINQFIVDTTTKTRLMFELGDQKPAGAPDRVLIDCEHRTRLLERIASCFLAESMARVARVIKFPKEERRIDQEREPWIPIPSSTMLAEDRRVLPFHGCQEVYVAGYSFFVRNEFEEIPSALNSRNKAVSFAAPLNAFGADNIVDRIHNVLHATEGNTEISVHVYDSVELTDLVHLQRENVRWAALEYKQAFLTSPNNRLLRDQAYLKKMNLSNDLAAWTCWEFLLQEEEYTTGVVMMRRQHVPPLMDKAQDLAVVIRCPSSKFEKHFGEDEFLHHAHLIADTMGPQAANVSLYPGVVQAKLDSLLYHEDSYGWMNKRLRMSPAGQLCLLKYGWVFVASITRYLMAECTLPDTQAMTDAAKHVARFCKTGENLEDFDPLTVPVRILSRPPDDISSTNAGDGGVSAIARQAVWQARVARYLTYCIDGGLLGTRLSLQDIVNSLVQGPTSDDACVKLEHVISFLLHLRRKAAETAFEPGLLRAVFARVGLFSPSRITGLGAEVCFTEKVMLLLVESGYLLQIASRSRRNDGKLNEPYCVCLSHLLTSRASSCDIKAAICRQVIAAKDVENATVLCPALLQVMRTNHTFLAAYACAALVNLCQSQDSVKSNAMENGAAEIILQLIRSNDAELVLYSLMFLVQLTKFGHHRQALKQAGLVPVLIDLLKACRDSLEHKSRIITELCSVLGQMCNDDDTRTALNERPHVLDALLFIFDVAEGVRPGWQEARKARSSESWETLPAMASRVLSKVLFILKQLCVDVADAKDVIGERTIAHIVCDLLNQTNFEHRDWAVNAVTLLFLLVVRKSNADRVVASKWMGSSRFVPVPGDVAGETLSQRISQLNGRLMEHGLSC